MTEPQAQVVEVIVGFIAVPWLGWVTASIFNLRQQTAVMRAEMDVLGSIKELLTHYQGGKSDHG